MSQKDFEILIELNPLETLFTQLSDEKKALYVEDLRPFSIAVIRDAVKKVRSKWDRVSFPPPGALVTECNVIAGKGGATGIAQSDGSAPWEKREKDIATATAEYVTRFMSISQIAAEARAGNYDDFLYHYVRGVAHVQAQLLHPRPDNRFCVSWHYIEPSDGDRAEKEKWRWQFTRDCFEIAKRGIIDVAIPTGKIEQWRDIATFMERQQGVAIIPERKNYSKTLAGVISEKSHVLPPPIETPPLESYEAYL